MPANQSSSGRLPSFLLILIVASGYFILARLSLLLSFESSNATPVWPPSGFAFAMILIFGYRLAPGILLGAFAANLVVLYSNHTTPVPGAIILSAVISIGNTAEALVGYYMLKKMMSSSKDNQYFNKVTRILEFSATALVMCLVSSLIGTTTVLIGKLISRDQYLTAWLTWWLGDFSGILLVTPFVLIWKNYFKERRAHKYNERRPAISTTEHVLLFLMVILTSGIVFDDWFFSFFFFKWAFWIIPVMVWAAIRFRQQETILAIAICSGIAIWGTLSGNGPYSTLSLNESLLIAQAFISILVITALTLNASIEERYQTQEALRLAGEQLENRVKERTAELQERNLFIETMFDSVVDLVAVFDTKGNYLSVNKKIETMYKKKREELIGKNILDVYPEVRTSGMYDNLLRAIAGETIHNISYMSVISKRYFENYYIPLRNNKREVYGVLVIGHDNTPVMEAQEKIQDINTKLNEAQRLAHIGSWQWNIADNRISWSDELYRIYGVIKGEFEANYENYLKYIHPDDKEFVNKIVQEAYASKQPFDFYHRIIRPDGKIRTIHGRGEILTNDNKETIAMAGTAQDVTEIKQAEEEIKQMANELLRYNKELEVINKELESFTFVASHDLQEPLRKIRTFLTLIADKELASLSDTGKDYLQRTVRSAEQMQQLIIDLLAYSRTTGSKEHFKKTDLNEVVQRVRSDLKELIDEKKAVIETDPLPSLHVIPFQFHQLFTNLLSNSIKFSKPGMQPHVQIKHEVVDGAVIDGENGDAGKKYNSFSVTDNGIGFETKYNEKVFGLFQRLNSKHVYNGTGIGLSICKRIVENHGGVIMARGERDKGTTIQFFIPHAATRSEESI